MPPPLTRKGRRITLWLFDDDCKQFEQRYGHGWSEQVRLLVERNCKEYLLWKRQEEQEHAE